MEYAEIVSGVFTDTGGMCKLCPGCGPCAANGSSCGASGPGCGSCAVAAKGLGAACDTYCHVGAEREGGTHALRREPCYPHQSYTKGNKPHLNKGWPGARYVGDFNNANQTNVYLVGAQAGAQSYTPYFTGAGFRYVQLSISGDPGRGNGSEMLSWLTAHQINSNVSSASALVLPAVAGSTSGVPDVLNKIHAMTRASQQSNLWSIPTDCPQRERRGWMGDAQVITRIP